jgi:hypothetical protein
MAKKQKVRAAAVQVAPDLTSGAATLERVIAAIDEAAGKGAEFIVFPETFVPWYPYFSFVTPPVQSGAEHIRLYEHAIAAPGPKPFDNFQAALEAPPERLRADLALLPELAEKGLARAAKDISQGGVPGTAVMLAESSGVSIAANLDAIEPPAGVALERWLRTFPSYGSLLSVAPRHVEPVLSMFRARELYAALIGAVKPGSQVTLHSEGGSVLLRDFGAERLMGFGAGARAA